MVSVVAYSNHGERHIFYIGDTLEDRFTFGRQLSVMANDPELEFDMYDAAIVNNEAQKVMASPYAQTQEEPGRPENNRLADPADFHPEGTDPTGGHF